MSCDIIIPVWNQLKLTKRCIEHIAGNTRYPYQLIIIDNGSQKPTEDYLKKTARDDKLRVTLIRNQDNLGYVKAVNQGISVSCADYICLLNNDTEVCGQWLAELVRVAESNSGIGIVNPGGVLKPFRKKQPPGKWKEIGFATGFCMLIKRELINKVGFFDEAFGIGFWEDTDYCRRAREAGYICASAEAACVYHLAHRTFDIFKRKRVNQLFEKNKAIFYAKWGRILRIACVVFAGQIDDRLISRISELARQGHIVYLFSKGALKIKAIDYVYIREIKYPGSLLGCLAAIKILHRQKKRFDNLITDSPAFARRMKSLAPGLTVELFK